MFETFEEAEYPIFRKKYMSMPIYDSFNQLITTIQIESKFRLNKEEKDLNEIDM